MNSSTQYILRSIKDILSAFIKARLWFHCSPNLQSGAMIRNDFFGINIAPSTDPRADDYIIDRLQELGVHNIRMDFTYTSLGGEAEVLLQRVLSESFQVMLDLLPPFEDAAILAEDMAAQQRWRDFINTVADQYGEQVACFEIGATPNRGRWSGFEPYSYLVAWKIANEQLATKNILLAGPNVSDFEPTSNISLLAEMQRQGFAPDIHTDNLFVERVIEPEACDHRALGRWMTNVFKLNLVKKARIIKDLSLRYDAAQTVCTYKCWTTKRLSRWSDRPEQKKADYLVRYLVIAATTEALDKVYWGPLICSRDGLINDGATGYPDIDNVSFYKEIRGDYEQFQPQEAFYALKNVVEQLSDTECVQALTTENGLNHFIFNTKESSQIHVAWTRDRHVLPLQLLYTPEQIAKANYLSVCGDALGSPVVSLSERPIFIEFEQHHVPKLNLQQMSNLSLLPEHTVFASIDDVAFLPWDEGIWRGAIAVKQGEDLEAKAKAMLPENLLKVEQLGVHRDQRNKVWSIRNPLAPDEILVVKQNRAQGMKKLTYRFMPSKGQRHWNNASEMIRRGIDSPMPIAYFERTENTGITHNYYVCEFVADSFSARDAFTAFAQGKKEYSGFSKETIFSALAKYICKMHNQKIIHNDLSGGNLLMKKDETGQIDVTVIDIGRATVLNKKKMTERLRLIDLMRACYKLDWPNREKFMQCYFDEYGQTFSAGWRSPLSYYDWKQKTKRKVKSFFKRKKKQ